MATDRLTAPCWLCGGMIKCEECKKPLAPPSPSPVKSDGGSTDYYRIPTGAADLLDLIEHKKMDFAIGNIFKACYRLGEKEGTDLLYDLNKIIFFAERKKALLSRNS